MIDRMRSISRQGLDAAFQTDETHKSDLVLQAALLWEQGQEEQSAVQFAEAAVIEERLRDRCGELGLVEKSFVHAFSAASCCARAGDFYHALALCDRLLAHTDLPERLRRRVGEYAATLRSRRSEWYAGLLTNEAAQEQEVLAAH